MSKSRIASLLLALVLLLGLAPPLQPAQAAGSLMVWNSATFTESSRNDGTIDGSIQINLQPGVYGARFQYERDMVKAGMVKVENLPRGYTCVISSPDGYYCQVSLEGAATFHEAANSISNLSIEFLASAFAEGNVNKVEGSSRDDIAIKFQDASTVGNDGKIIWEEAVFSEGSANDGSIANVITVTLQINQKDFFGGFVSSSDMVAEERAEVRNLPADLQCVISTIDSTHCQIALVGQAQKHSPEDSRDNLEVTFLDRAFTSKNASWVLYCTHPNLEIVFSGEPEEIAQPEEEEDDTQAGDQVESSFKVGSTVYYVNGVEQSMDVAPFADQGRIFVPIRYLANCLYMSDSNISWDGQARSATLSDDETTVIFILDKPVMYVNGQAQAIDVAPRSLDNRLFLPARYVVEAFGGTVAWNADIETVTVLTTL